MLKKNEIDTFISQRCHFEQVKVPSSLFACSQSYFVWLKLIETFTKQSVVTSLFASFKLRPKARKITLLQAD